MKPSCPATWPAAALADMRTALEAAAPRSLGEAIRVRRRIDAIRAEQSRRATERVV